MCFSNNSGFPNGSVVATPDTLCMDFGLEGVSDEAVRASWWGRAIDFLLNEATESVDEALAANHGEGLVAFALHQFGREGFEVQTEQRLCVRRPDVHVPVRCVHRKAV